MIASIWCSGGALLVSIIIGLVCPGYTARPPVDNGSDKMSPQHYILTLFLIAEVYLSFHVLKQIRFRSNLTKYEPCETSN